MPTRWGPMGDEVYNDPYVTITLSGTTVRTKMKEWIDPPSIAAMLTDGPVLTIPRVDNVIFNNPATIVYWKDGTKTVVKVREGDTFDKWTGLAMAHMKKLYGDKFHAKFREWCKEDEQ